jgi:hypothetical protein
VYNVHDNFTVISNADVDVGDRIAGISAPDCTFASVKKLFSMYDLDFLFWDSVWNADIPNFPRFKDEQTGIELIHREVHMKNEHIGFIKDNTYYFSVDFIIPWYKKYISCLNIALDMPDEHIFKGLASAKMIVPSLHDVCPYTFFFEINGKIGKYIRMAND